MTKWTGSFKHKQALTLIGWAAVSFSLDACVDQTFFSEQPSAEPTVVTVNVPLAITGQPLSQTVVQGNSVTFSVIATGAAPLIYQWEKDGVDIPGATAASYTISAVQSLHAGNYTVRVSNSAGSVTSNPTVLTVNVPLAITGQPLSQTVVQGNSVTFSVIATGTAPLIYQWEKDGVDIPGATAASYTISTVLSLHSGNYTVGASNSAGSILSNVAVLTVTLPAIERPTFRYPSQYNTFKKISELIPAQGAVILVEPGSYNDGISLFNTDGKITIRGILGPDGKRPHIYKTDASAVFGLRSKPPLNTGTGELELENLELSGTNGGNIINYISGKAVRVNNLYVHHGKNGFATSHVHGGTVEIRDSEFAFNGQGGNTTHNIYISFIDNLLVENIYSHDSRGGHALKYVARRTIIKNNRLATSSDLDTFLSTPKMYRTTTLLDGLACAESVITGNTLIRYGYYDGGYSNANFMDIRQRNSVNGCDKPFGYYLFDISEADALVKDANRMPILDLRFQDPGFWAAVKAVPITDPNNVYSFKHFVVNNSFENYNLESGVRAIGFFNEGTAPVESTEPRGSCPGGQDGRGKNCPTETLIPKPDGWLERTVVFAINNKFIGDPLKHRYLELKDADHGGPIVQLGGDDGFSISLPPWFKTSLDFSVPVLSYSVLDTGSVLVSRVGHDGTTVTAPAGTIAKIDNGHIHGSGFPNPANPAHSGQAALTTGQFDGAHIVYVTDVAGYAKSAGICSYSSISECVVSTFPIAPTCDGLFCSLPIVVLKDQSIKVVFKYIKSL